MNTYEHQALVVDYNNTAAPYPDDRTIVDLFVGQVKATPDDEAIRVGGDALTYRELHDRSDRFSAHLQSAGVRQGDLVVVMMEHSIEVVCAILGVLKAGAAYVPVDPSAPKGRVAFMLQDIAEGWDGMLPTVVTQNRLVGRLPAGASRVVVLDAGFAAIADVPATDAHAKVFPRDLAYVIYTSGSTGKPKGVMIEHRSLVNYIWWARQKYSANQRLSWPLFSSLAFDLTVTSIFTPLISGGRIVVYREDPAMPGMVIMDVVQDNIVDIVKLTPAHIAMINDLNLRSSTIRKFIV